MTVTLLWTQRFPGSSANKLTPTKVIHVKCEFEFLSVECGVSIYSFIARACAF